jgi:voltage-dependent potassium channel beta subunit
MSSTTEKTPMTYRFLGDSGLLVSKLALGSWMHFDASFTVDAWFDLMHTAFDHGINFFDTAEAYGSGQAEELLGGAISKGVTSGVWSRENLVISTKIFFGSKVAAAGPNDQGISRKHIVEGTRASLQRLQLDYVDVVFCHRNEPFTPVEEVVRAMNFVINQGWAFYWGTSEWSAAEIDEACAVADRLHLIRPIVEQPQYNLLTRTKVEYEFADLFKRRKLGLTVWSPLAMGILTGKYSGGDIPEGARLANPGYRSAVSSFDDSVAIARQLEPIAKRLDCSLAQLAIAWCVSNENVSTVLLGARNSAQLVETAGAMRVVPKVTKEVKAEIDAIVKFVPLAPGAAPADPLRMVRSIHQGDTRLDGVMDAWHETVKRDDDEK